MSRILRVTMTFKLGSGPDEDGSSIKGLQDQQDSSSPPSSLVDTVEEEEKPEAPDPDDAQPHLLTDV